MKVVSIITFFVFWDTVVFAQNTAEINGRIIQRSDIESFYFKTAKDVKETIQNKTVTLLLSPRNTQIAQTKTDDEGRYRLRTCSGKIFVARRT